MLAAEFRRWPFYKRWFGQRSERTAARFLRKRGHRIIAANWSDRLGELDLLTLDGPVLVIVEVRSTSGPDAQVPLDSVDAVKQKRISDAAIRFLSKRRLLGKISVRFDVVAISWPASQRQPTVLHIEQAFDATGRFQFFS